MFSFVVCVAMALINLPFVLQDGGSVLHLASMIFCGALAVFSLVMSAVAMGKK